MQLTDTLADSFRLTDSQLQALGRLKLFTLHDLLYHFPTRYEHVSDIRSIASVKAGEEVAIYGTLSKLEARKSWKTKRPMGQGRLTDGTGNIQILWFNQPYMAKMFNEGALVKAVGKIAGTAGKEYLSNPEIEHVTGMPDLSDESLFGNGGTDVLYPVYPESKGITSKWFYHNVQKIFADKELLGSLSDIIPDALLEKYNLPRLTSALVWIHTPKKLSQANASRKRFSFEEIFLIQLAKQQEKALLEKEPTYSVEIAKNTLKRFVSQFEFTPTGAQLRAIEDILKDFGSAHPMSRLLEGDVGSGKTFVAAATSFAIVSTHPKDQDFGNLQVAYMAPTEILAKQHFESFIEYFTKQNSGLALQIGLITGSGCRKFPSKVDPSTWTDISRAQLLKWVANGEIPIVFGTHALIQKTVRFQDLAYVIIDEQHRFGTMQRKALARKEERVPHLLSMTATPIPRTLALTMYGDLDLTLLDELPVGRKKIKTTLVTPEKREVVYEQIREELLAGRQAYIICPRIDEPDPKKANAIRAKSVKEESKRVQSKVFPEHSVGMLHGQMSAKEKDEVMRAFSEKEIDILVATSVVEVGVNVPNATVIIIEGAERFGLSQLHQLRGRVFRSSHQAYCYLFTESKARPTLERLRALVSAKDGFALAEQDLMLRGAGELAGKSQWGISDVGMEALRNIKMVEAARTEATALVKKDWTLEKHPDLRQRANERVEHLHFE